MLILNVVFGICLTLAIPYWLLWMELFSWQGPFYPLNLENSRWLSYYSRVFDFVEIDSSFYRTPNAFMVKNWWKKTPNQFRFTAKFPKVITHDKRLKDVEKELELFFSSMINLEDKILALLIQLPPSMGIVEGMPLPVTESTFVAITSHGCET